MKIFLNGNEVDKELFTVNHGLNYGRFYDKDTKVYEIRIKQNLLIELIEDKYVKARDEIRLDDERFNDSSDFKDSGYCSLKELFKQPEVLESIILTYLDRELFLELFKNSLKKQFIINSTDSIKVNSDEIIIKGRVYENS